MTMFKLKNVEKKIFELVYNLWVLKLKIKDFIMKLKLYETITAKIEIFTHYWNE